MSRKFWNFAKDEESENRVLTIDGVIAEESWFDDDVTPKQFRDELTAGNGDITVYINSPGGDCIAASQIFTMLVEYTGKVTVRIDGMAASAASVIAMAGNVVQMAPTAMLMIHNPSTFAAGNEKELRKAIETLAEFKESIINAYELKTGLQRAHIARLMDDETWMNARKAIELGFADEMIRTRSEAVDMAAFEFAAKASERSIMKRIAAKIDAKEKAKAPQKSGRKIEDLMHQLEARKH